MANQGNVFAKLSEKWNAPGSSRFVKVLESMVTPEEGELLLELWTPTTCDDLAKKLKMDKNSLLAKLDGMVKKKVITVRNETYSTPTRLIPLCHATVNLSTKSDQLWTDFFLNDWTKILAEERYQRRLTGTPSVHRILPALQALKASPNIRPEQILWYEDLAAMIEKSKGIVFNPCSCRAQYHLCDNNVNTCMHAELEDDKSPHNARWAQRKQYTRQEALDVLYAAEDAGMCHLSPNHPRLQEVCSCCDDCCRVIHPLINAAKDYDLNDPTRSRFEASIDREKCNGCQTCVGRCMFNAVVMTKAENSKKLKAQVIKEKCMGCGLCVYKCEQKAIRFDVVRPPDHIPPQTRDQAMSWEPAKK